MEVDELDLGTEENRESFQNDVHATPGDFA
jgi:hypothetical protein